MPANQVAGLLRRFCGVLAGRPDRTADAILLERFACHADQRAFAELVQRHGPLVWSVSRRVARHEQDAEDVYQATFLLLARKARAIRKGGSVASWLYGVAHRLALRTRTDAARRRLREEQAAGPVPPTTADDLTWRELREVLDEELARLPEKYRAPLLLCYFDGLTQEEAARQLGWNRRSVKYRLECGRDQLRARLARRGLTLPMALAGPLLAGGFASAAPPAALTEIAVRAAVPFALCRPVGREVSAQVLALAEGGLQAVFVGKFSMLAAGLLAAVLLGGAALLAGTTARQTAPGSAAPGRHDPEGAVDRYGDPLPPGAVRRLGTVRYRFTGSGTTFLPDGKTVITVGQGKAIPFWDAQTGRLLRELDTGKLTVGWQHAFSRGAKRLAVSGAVDDEKVGWRSIARVLDTATGKVLRTFDRDDRDEVHALALSPDGELVFSLGREGKLRVHEVATGAELLRQKFPGDVGAALAVSPDGSTLAVASGPNTRKMYLWKWQAGEEPRPLKVPERSGRALVFSPNGKLLADCNDGDPTVRVWDAVSGRLLHKLEVSDHVRYYHFHVAFSADGKMLAASGSHNLRAAVHLWEPATGKFLKRLDIGAGALAFSPDGSLLVAGDRVWDFGAGKELSVNPEAARGAVERAVAANGVVVTASGDNTVRLWDPATGKQRLCLVHDGWIRDIALSPDGTRLASSSLDDTVGLWDMATGKRIYRLAGHGQLGGRRAVAFTPDGKAFLSWGDDNYLRKWDVRTGKAVSEHTIRPGGVKLATEDDEPRERELLGLGGGIEDGRFSPGGKHLLLRAGNHFFVVDAGTGKELRKFPAEGGHLIGKAVSPDGKLLLTSTWGEPVQIRLPNGMMRYSTAKNHPIIWYDLTTGKPRSRIFLPEEGAGPVAFAPNGKLFAAASSRPKGVIRLVEVATGREVRKIEGFRGQVRSLTFLPDGRHLVSGMEDSSALIWDLGR
jgi:RNA polymerase sigma factor (sigma-70 family)